MSWGEILRRVTTQSPVQTGRTVWTKTISRGRELRQRDSDHRHPTYGPAPAGSLARLVGRPDVTVLTPEQRMALAGTTTRFVDGQFDILGSGWLAVSHGLEARGFEGHRFPAHPSVVPDPEGHWLAERLNSSNVDRAREVWRLISPQHVPVDWQLDIKSGYRWSERTWYRDVRYGDEPGVDVKVPWELGRLQHLPQLAIAFASSKVDAEGFRAPETYLEAFTDHALDFIATNPPRFGVQWTTTMDVAIRATNLALGFDLFRAAGGCFAPEVERVIQSSLTDHARHVVDNLEWYEDLRSNHYLCNIAGLLALASYLPESPETNTWLRFARHEILSETAQQFLPDGSNFEASTCYHRLSTEAVVYATAFLKAVPVHRWEGRPEPSALPKRPRLNAGDLSVSRPVVPPDHLARLARTVELTRAATRPDGRVVQIGDNDSGRFVKLRPSWRRLSVAEAIARYENLRGYAYPKGDDYWYEDTLDHNHLLRAVGAVVGSDVSTSDIEVQLLRGLADGCGDMLARSPSPHVRVVPPSRDMDLHGRTIEIRCPIREPLTSELEAFALPDFGLFTWRSRRVYLAVRCGPIGQRGNGGHAHNDQLSFELVLDDVDWIRDPGTYVYTALPDRRNEYRSSRAHAGPEHRDEPSGLTAGLFTLANDPLARCIKQDDRSFIGEAAGADGLVRRHFVIADESITVVDEAPGAFERVVVSTPEQLRDALAFAPPPFSPAYGWRESPS